MGFSWNHSTLRNFRAWSALVLLLFGSTASAGLDLPSDGANPVTAPLSREPARIPFLDGSEIPKSISIPAGVPLVGAGDANGGFGDVAANIEMAKAFKKAYPAMEVQLIVELFEDKREKVASVEQIVRTLLPEIDVEKIGVAQIHDGVSVYVVRDQQALPPLPKCELAVQYSANRSPRSAILKATGEDWFSFFEPGASRTFVESGSLFSSGFFSTGVYDLRPERNPEEAKESIRGWWREKSGEALEFAHARVGYAYTKEASATAEYLRAVGSLARANPAESYVVFAKRFPGQSGVAETAETTASNLRVILLDGFPSDIGKDFLQASDLPPIVTGDNSFATALLSTRRDRAFIYEVLSWKDDYASDLQGYFATHGRKANYADLFYRARDSRSGKMLRALTDANLAAETHRQVVKLRRRLSLVENTLKVRLLRKKGKELLSVFSNRDLLQGEFSRLFLDLWMRASDEEGFARMAGKRLVLAKRPVDAFRYAAMKWMAGYSLTDREKAAFFRALEELPKLDHYFEKVPIAKLYGIFLVRHPRFLGQLSESRSSSREAYAYQAGFRELWELIAKDARDSRTFEMAAADGCRAHLQRD
jgi:hypothetical protein